MMNNLTEKFHTMFEKIKKIKHIEIYIAIAFAVIIIGIYLSTLISPAKNEDNSQNSTNQTETFSSSQEYTEYLENKLTNVLASVKGAGAVNVVVTLENGFEYIYATEDETKTSADGGQVTISKVILVDGKPVLEKEVYPQIKGVVVTASGADDISVKLNLLTALQTVVEVANQNITILTGN